MKKINNKNFNEISYRFFNIRGKGYCPIEVTTYDIITNDVRIYDCEYINQHVSYPTIGIAMTSGIEGYLIDVAYNPYLESDDADCLVHEDELHDP